MLMCIRGFLAVCALTTLFPGPPAHSQTGPVLSGPPELDEAQPYQAALQLLDADRERQYDAAEWFRRRGKKDAVPALITALRYAPAAGNRAHIRHVLQDLTGFSHDTWFDWMRWQQSHSEIRPFERFGAFKGAQLARHDPAFAGFVHEGVDHSIRLEEIVWGGVPKDGIPDLSNPKFLPAGEAGYLDDEDVVFGVEINGDARAYPLRILDWHEMLNDTVGGIPVCLTYCILCGSGILYESRPGARRTSFEFGTSGLLYRSNKLMYDRATWSLWNQFTGRPVVGLLTESGIRLKIRPMVITGWAQWRARHPGTKVLSPDTGYRRNYSPGAAYGDYVESRELMFPVATADARLNAKDLVFALRLSGAQKAWPLNRFKGGAVVNDRAGLLRIVLVGSADARTVRAWRAANHIFSTGPRQGTLSAEDGSVWHITEAALIGPDGRRLDRLPGHIAYWFAWAGFIGKDGELAENAR